MTHHGVLAIANRGEIAVRIARTAERHGWQPVVLLSEAERSSYAARAISRVELLQPGDELRPRAVVEAARRSGARALHPGYGFLSERADLSHLCREAGITFIGPSPETLQICGDKLATRQAAEASGLPLVPASRSLTLDNPDEWWDAAEAVGYPLIVKVTGAGGGRGLRVARTGNDLEAAIRSAINEAGGSGAEPTVFLEHFLEGARHVEVQVAGDGENAIALGDRDCSLQRRYQKVIEEGPAPGLSDEVRSELHRHATVIARAVNLFSLATIEFLLAGSRLAFMEINPRLQVEHTVTEETTGLDLVAVQLRLATGGALPDPVESRGHAIQARLYAEDPFNQFLPSPGLLRVLDIPTGANLRIDGGYEAGDTVPGEYDPLIAKLIASGENREQAIDRLRDALTHLRIAGIATNRPWLLALLDSQDFRNDTHDLSTAGAVQLENRPPPREALETLAGSIGGARHGEPGAWAATGPFRIVPPATLVLHGDEAGGWQETIQLPHHPDQTAADVTHDNPGIAVVEHDGSFELSTPEGRWMVRPGPRPASAAHQTHADGVLRAPMPGKVLAVHARQGESTHEGEVLAVLEAMKIEITLSAPFAGRVTGIHAASGDLVGTSQLIVTVSPEEDDQHEEDGSDSR